MSDARINQNSIVDDLKSRFNDVRDQLSNAMSRGENAEDVVGFDRNNLPTSRSDESVGGVEGASNSTVSNVEQSQPLSRMEEMQRRAGKIRELREEDRLEKQREADRMAAARNSWSGLNLDEIALKMAYDSQNAERAAVPLLPMTQEEAADRQAVDTYNSLSSVAQDALRTLGADPNSLVDRRNEEASANEKESKQQKKEHKEKIDQAREQLRQDVSKVSGTEVAAKVTDKAREKIYKRVAAKIRSISKGIINNNKKNNKNISFSERDVSRLMALARNIPAADENAAEDVIVEFEQMIGEKLDSNQRESLKNLLVEASQKRSKDKKKKQAEETRPAERDLAFVSDIAGNTVAADEMSDDWQHPDLIGYTPQSLRIPRWLLKKKKTSDDEKIQEHLKRQSDSLLSGIFKNRREVGISGSTEEEYARDYASRSTVDVDPSKYGSNMSEREIAQIEAMEKQLEWIGSFWVPTEGQTIDDEGNIRTSPLVAKEINAFMAKNNFAPHERGWVHHIVAKRLGYAPDRNGKFLLEDTDKIPDALFIQALRDADLGMELFDNPYHLFAHNAGTKYGGTKCFPIGVMLYEEAAILCRENGPLSNMDPYDAMSLARNEFVNVTMWEIRKEAHRAGEKGIAQLVVLSDYVRALCSLNADLSSRDFNVPETVDRGYEEILWECDPLSNPDADPEVLEERRKRAVREEQRRNARQYRFDRLRNRTSSVYKEDVYDKETGELLFKRGDRINPKTYVSGSTNLQIRSSKVHPFDAACTFVCTSAKFMGVIGFTPVLIGGYLEHFSGNIYTSMSNRMLAKTFAMYGENDGDAFRVNEALYRYMTTEEGVDGIKAWKALMRVGGQDAVALFYDGARYGQLTTDNVRKFLDDCVNKESLFTGKKAQIAKNIAAHANEVFQLLLPGDLGFGKKDARRWIEGFMLNNQINANNARSKGASQTEHAFTTSEVVEMIESMGVGGFLAAATATRAGRDSAVMMRYSTLARESPLSHAVDTIFRRCGLANVVVTLGIDTYFTYGLNMVQAMLPMSSTVSYLAVRGINYAATGGIDNQSKENLNILEYQMGGLDSFGTGLVKNLLYDGMKLLNVGIFGCFIAAVFMMIGFDEPEDPGLKYRWDEYIIGKKIALGGYDENGEPQGIPLYRAWWLDDLTLFGLPIAYALCAQNIDQKKPDPDLPRKIFMDGCYDVVSGASIFDLVRSVKNAEQVLMEFDDAMTDPDKKLKADYVSYVYMNFFELPLARAANKLFVPNGLRDAFRDEYEHSPYVVYNRDSTTPGATESVDDWVELQRRIESRYNPVYAIFNNLVHNKYLLDKGDTQKTGYLYTEMPLAFEPDARRVTFLETKLDYVPLEEFDLDQRETKAEEYCDKLYELIRDEYDFDVDKAVADGFMIPFDIRFEFDEYLVRRQNYVNNVYNEAKKNGVRGVELTEMWEEKERLWNEYDKILDDFVWNTAKVPWTDKSYVRLRTDYETVYYRKSTNEPVPETEYLFENVLKGGSDIEKRYVPKGNRPNNLALFTSPETQNRGFNYETISAWYDNERSDLEKIYNEQSGIDPNKPISEQQGKFAKYGYSKNVPLNSSMFGGDISFPTATPVEDTSYASLDEPTAGRRALAPFEESMLWDLPNYNGTIAGNNGSGSGGAGDAANTSGSNSSSGSDNSSGSQKAENKNIPENSVKNQLKSITRENVDPGNLGELGKYIDWSNDSTGSTSSGGWGSGYGYGYGYTGSRSSGGSSSYIPKIYSNPRSISADRAATMYTKAPQSARTTYLNPGFSTKGSREAYKRQDI